MWRTMMGFIHFAVAVLSLLSGGQSAPVTSCENLIQPTEIQGRDQLLGRWMFLAESTNVTGSRLLTKMFVESAWSNITAANESDTLKVHQYQKMLGRCFTLTTEMTLKNSTLSMVQPTAASEVLLQTGCPDCLVIYSKYTIGRNTYSGLQFLSRRKEVSAANLEEFTRQALCLNLPPPAILDPEKGLCQDESSSQETETIDLTNFMNESGSELFNLFDMIISSEGGIKTLTKFISGSIAGIKEN